MTAMGPVALVMNPAATRSGHAVRGEITRALAPHGLGWALTTRERGEAGALASQAVAEGAGVVVALGGDGTAAEVAGALAGGSVPMAPLPGGNANVFARALGWPAHPLPAVHALATALDAGRVREAGLGVVEAGGTRHVFTINAGVGIDAATVEWIEARPRTKRRLRQAGFAIGVAVAAARAGRAPRLLLDGEGIDPVEAVAVLTACGTPYTYLGRRPLDLVPGAAFDGSLAWVALTRLRPHELVPIAVRALRGRDLPLGGPALRGGDAVAGLTVRADGAVPVQADGEPLGRYEHVAIGPGPRLLVVDPPGAAALKSGASRPT